MNNLNQNLQQNLQHQQNLQQHQSLQQQQNLQQQQSMQQHQHNLQLQQHNLQDQSMQHQQHQQQMHQQHLGPQQKIGAVSGLIGDHYSSAYTGISPPSRPLSREDLYGQQQQQQNLPDGVLQGSMMHQRPAPLSPTEVRGGVMVTTSGMVKSLERPRQTSLFGFKKNKSLRPDLGETWPTTIDLSPILDVSPSVEAAEQETNGRQDTKGPHVSASGVGTQQGKSSISGMLSDFTRALGLGGNSPKDEQKGQVVSTYQQQKQAQSQIQTQANLITSQMAGQQQQAQMAGHQQGQMVGPQQVYTSSGQVVTQLANHVGPGVANVPNTVVGGQVVQNPTVVVSAGQQPGGQPLLFQQMTPAQQLQLQQMQLQHQAQHLKKMRRQDQAAALQQQLITQGKISPTPLRKDAPAAVPGLQQLQNLQQQHLAGKVGARVNSNLPTAALLQQSTIATSDGKPRMLVMPGQTIPTTETPLSSLHRRIGRQDVGARLRSSSDQLASPEEFSMSGVNAQLAMLTGTPSTPAGTPRGLRDDSSDTMSETDSQKSLRIRRKLPHLPPDQEAAPLPSHKKNSFGLNAKDRVRSQMARQSSLDGTSSSGRVGGSLTMGRPSSSMTNLANISKTPDITLPIRPGSALGILGHTSNSMRSSTTSGPQLKSGLPSSIAQCLPPDLHHLIYTNVPPHSIADNYGSQQLPEYMQNLKEQLREELKSTTGDRRAILEAELLRLHEDRRRALTDKDKDRDGRLRRELDRLSSSSYTGSLTLKQRMEIQRRLGMTSGTSNSTGSASSSPRNHRRRGHRRQMSDPKIFSSISPIKEDKDLEKELERSLYGGSLRDTAINCMDDDDLLAARLLGLNRNTGRRSSESGLATEYWGRSSTPAPPCTTPAWEARYDKNRQKNLANLALGIHLLTLLTTTTTSCLARRKSRKLKPRSRGEGSRSKKTPVARRAATSRQVTGKCRVRLLRPESLRAL
ncbi:uncharacterized protein LOC119569342 [Penaeus monodon]|uniref:uncharacterized protein LOC119569342 n=1 Tax=Penaeus monodon TaxID=6687 RepID=UPI0018A6F40F|nr:uncharacterized protein LOC119569342 [Penaeus monodon]